MNENREVIKKAMEMQFLETKVSLKKKKKKALTLTSFIESPNISLAFVK